MPAWLLSVTFCTLHTIFCVLLWNKHLLQFTQMLCTVTYLRLTSLYMCTTQIVSFMFIILIIINGDGVQVSNTFTVSSSCSGNDATTPWHRQKRRRCHFPSENQSFCHCLACDPSLVQTTRDLTTPREIHLAFERKILTRGKFDLLTARKTLMIKSLSFENSSEKEISF